MREKRRMKKNIDIEDIIIGIVGVLTLIAVLAIPIVAILGIWDFISGALVFKIIATDIIVLLVVLSIVETIE